MKFSKIVLVYILSMAVVCGCMPQVKKPIVVNNQAFDTAEEALNFNKAVYKETIEDKVPPTKTPVVGKVYLIIPTETYYKNVVSQTSKVEEAKKFIVGVSLFNDQAFHKELKARKIFDEVVLKTSDDPDKDVLAIKDMTVIYRSAKPGFVQNFVKKKSGEIVEILYSAVLKGKLIESRIDIFDQIEKAAK